MTRISQGAALALALLASGPATAHVMLSQPEAPASSTYTADFRVTHGCAGSATTALRVEIPADVTGARPQPKPGWTLTIEHQPLAKPVAGDGGRVITERVSAVTWSGGSLPDDEWDAFGLSAKLPARTGPLSFPAVQTCEHGEARWTDAPAAGHPPHPAPTVTLTPAGSDDGMTGMPGMSMGR
jgi:uncharacterized protein YcnI